MTIGENIQAILNLLRGLEQKVDALQANTDIRFTNVDNALADLKAVSLLHALSRSAHRKQGP